MTDTVEKGSAAASHPANIKYDVGSKVNSPDSVLGGSAATNFPVTPKYKMPPGGIEVEALKTSGTYSVPVKDMGGQATNDRAK